LSLIQAEYNVIVQRFEYDVANFENEYQKHIEQLLAPINSIKQRDYDLQRCVVFNQDLKGINPKKVRLILVGDNPGQNEQRFQAYFSRSSGTTLRKFISELGYTIRGSVQSCKNNERELTLRKERDSKAGEDEVIILNKSVVHSSQTDELAAIKKDKTAGQFFKENQKYMAQLIYRLHTLLNRASSKGCSVWILGTSSLNGIFGPFRSEILDLYGRNIDLRDRIFLHGHPSCGNHLARNIYSTFSKLEGTTGIDYELFKRLSTTSRDDLLRFRKKAIIQTGKELINTHVFNKPNTI